MSPDHRKPLSRRTTTPDAVLDAVGQCETQAHGLHTATMTDGDRLLDLLGAGFALADREEQLGILATDAPSLIQGARPVSVVVTAMAIAFGETRSDLSLTYGSCSASPN